MDMSNVTTGGPSRGLLDVIFGKAKEEEPADGKDNPLMNLIKALSNKDQEDTSNVATASSRTEKGTGTGSDSAESRATGIPEMLMQMGVIQDAKPQAKDSLRDEKAEQKIAELIQAQQMQPLQNLSMQQLRMPMGQLGATAMGIQPRISLIQQLDPEQVNAALKANDLPPLTEAESKLLAEVNKQAAKVNQDSLLQAGEADPKAANRLGSAELSNFLVELQKRGIDPSMIKEAAVAASSTPEKIMSTEAYLSMHDAMLKPVAKDQTESMPKNLADVLANAKQPISSENPSQSGKDFSDMFGGSEERSLMGKINEEAAKPANGMEASFLHSLKSQLDSAKVGTQEVFLPTGKPELMRNALVSEVANTVNMQAVKGGGEMRLVVHPPEMGELRLKVGAKEGGKIEVHVTAQNDDVANMIREGSGELQKSLRDQSLTLSKFEVAVTDTTKVASADSKGSSMEQSFQQNQQNSFAQSFGQGTEDRSSRWENSERNARPGENFSGLMDNIDTKRLAAKRAGSSRAYAGRSSTGRLDVVA